MARKALLVLAAAAAAVGIVATGAAAGAVLTGDGADDGFGVAASPSPSSSATPPGNEGSTPPGDDDSKRPDDSTRPDDDGSTPPDDDGSARPDDDGSTPPGDPAPGGGAVGRDQAIDIALATTGGGTVVDTEREWEHGRPAWKIEIVKGGVEHKVYVDRETGGIVKLDRDDDNSGKGN